MIEFVAATMSLLPIEMLNLILKKSSLILMTLDWKLNVESFAKEAQGYELYDRLSREIGKSVYITMNSIFPPTPYLFTLKLSQLLKLC